jgi:uncharacterized protein
MRWNTLRRRAVWVIIDGYNVTRSSGFSDDYRTARLQSEREKFLVLVAGYKARTANRITVVFDAAKTDELTGNRADFEGVEVVYTRGGQSADDLIKEYVENYANPGNVLVVTSDKAIIAYVKALGGSTAGAEELYGKLKRTEIGPRSRTADDFERTVKGYRGEDAKNQQKGGFSKRGKKDKRKLKLW